MTVTAGILTLLVTLVPFGIWLWKRRAAQQETPEAKRDEIDKAIADGNQNDVNRLLDDAVRPVARLRDESSRDSG